MSKIEFFGPIECQLNNSVSHGMVILASEPDPMLI